MEPELYQRVSDIFTRACETSPESREAFLEEACGNDQELLQLVRDFLAHDYSIADPPPIRLTTPDSPDLQPGDQVRNYCLETLIGEGGMGLVYLADQREPVRRTVALKIMRAGMDTRSLLARFDQERHVLALMDHPNIAKVYDAGATESGRPYFVMEYVAGAPITAYCDENHLSIRARLELFIQVCQAIQHAHQKGIIHRDIKPSNVLVTEVDGRPVPKVIDFGIARALEPTGEGATIYTQPGVMLGTPEYMSPEQALGREAPDTRTDVYSLGVILYELLVGQRPIERDDLGGQTIDSLRRAIVDTDPKRPSTRIRELGVDATPLADRRSMDAPRLEKLLRVDLDWIVMRAIEKDRARRYASASELAADVERYLAGEPVIARPPTTRYRVGKYVRKHRYLVIGATAVVLALSAGMGATAWQAKVARDRLDRIQQVSRILVSRFYDLADQVGGIQTKESLAQLAVVTLDDLARKSHLSVQEKTDLANAYEALAQVQGDPYSSSLGLVTEGRRSISAALRLRTQLFASDSSNVAAAANLIKCQYLTASLYQGAPDVDGPALVNSALELSDNILGSREVPKVMVLASICDILSAELESALGRTDETMEHLAHATRLRERLVAIAPADDEYQRLLSDVYKTVAYVTDDADESLRLANRALEIDSAYVQEHPFSWRGLMDLSYAHRNVGYAWVRNGDTRRGVYHMKACLFVREQMATADTLDMRARHFVADGYHLVGSAFADAGQMDSAAVYHSRGVHMHERMCSLSQPPDWLPYEMSYGYLLMAEAYAALGDTTKGRWNITRSIARDGDAPTEPSTYLKRLRATEEYAHFTNSIGDTIEAVRRHGGCFGFTRNMMVTLAENNASQTAFADVVSSFCHIADFMAPSSPAYANNASLLAVQIAVRWLGYAHPLTVRSMAARAQTLARFGDREGAREQYMEALAFQPECVIAFRPQARILKNNIQLLSSAPDPPGSDVTVFMPRYRNRSYGTAWAQRTSLLTKRNRLWGQEAWPVVAPLAGDDLFTAGWSAR